MRLIARLPTVPNKSELLSESLGIRETVLGNFSVDASFF